MVCSVSQTVSLIKRTYGSICNNVFANKMHQLPHITAGSVYVYWKPSHFFHTNHYFFPSWPLCNLAYPPPFRPLGISIWLWPRYSSANAWGLTSAGLRRLRHKHNKKRREIWRAEGKRPTKKSRYFFFLGWHRSPSKEGNHQLKVGEFNQKRFQE